MNPKPAIEFDPITREQIADYAEASGDPNRIHLDDSYAQKFGLPGIVAHGMLTMGLAARALDQWGYDLGKMTDFESRFKDKVLPGDQLKAEILSESDTEISWHLINQNGGEVLQANAKFS